MRPPAVYGNFKVVPPGGDTLNGLFIPEGTSIGHNHVAIVRNEKVFGADVDVFRPERFLDCPEEGRAEMERSVDMIFGTGRWMCAGKALVQVELNKTIFEVSEAVHESLERCDGGY
jgi:cytochrome P450